MKKIVASVGMIALGVSRLSAGMDGAKPWNVSVALRGFYDDNVNTVGSDVALPPGESRATTGFEVSPAVSWSWSAPQTTINLDYVYAFRYYENKPASNTDHVDQEHTFRAALDHSFSERYQMAVRDSFIIGQEPDTLRAGNSPFTTIQRISGDNMVNAGAIDFNGQMTRLLGFSLGYANTYYDYHDEAADPNNSADNPSLSGRLDRMEHTIHLDSRWVVTPDTFGIFGYQFRQVNYTGDEQIGVNDNGIILSDNRDYHQHYLYVGGDHTFRPDLTGSLRVGASYIDFYNDPNGNGNGWSPYLLGSIRWTYQQNCYTEMGVSHDMSSTDIVAAQNNGFVAAQESTVLYASVSHLLTQKLRGTINGSYQNSEFNGGGVDGETEQFFLIGLNLEYKFTPNFSASAGYNYDKVQSDIGRTYDRNRVYLGLTASY